MALDLPPALVIAMVVVVIFGAITFAFVSSQSDKFPGIKDWFDNFFTQNVTDDDYNTALRSANALVCAVNSVSQGKLWYGTGNKCSEFYTEKGSPGYVTLGHKDIKVECSETSPSSIGKITFAATDDNSAHDYCEDTCTNDCEVSLKKEKMEYHAIQKEKTLIRCDCYCGDVQKGSNLGLINRHAEQECEKKCSDSDIVEVKNCVNIHVDTSKFDEESTKFYNDIIDDAKIIPSVGKQCICRGENGEEDKHYSYGVDDIFAGWDMCWSFNYKGSASGDCSDFEGNLLFYEDNDIKGTGYRDPLQKYVCDRTADTMKCKVIHFQLPQKISVADEWIKGFGDPAFLVYYQKFPNGPETAWSGASVWIENAVDVFFAWFLIGKGVKLGKTIITATGKKMAAKIGSKVAIGRDKIINLFKTPIKAFIARLEKDAITKAAAKKAGEGIKEALLKDAGKLAKKLIVLDVIEIFANQIVSTAKKYEHYDDSMVLKIPYGDPVPIKLLAENEPVILKDPEYEFWMASPCDANIEIEKKTITCEGFKYDMDTGLFSCGNPTDYDDYVEIPLNEKCFPDILDTKPLMSAFQDNNIVARWLLEGTSPDRFRDLYVKNNENEFVIKDPVFKHEFVFCREEGLDNGFDCQDHTEPKEDVISKCLGRKMFYSDICEHHVASSLQVGMLKKFIFVKSDGKRTTFELEPPYPLGDLGREWYQYVVVDPEDHDISIALGSYGTGCGYSSTGDIRSCIVDKFEIKMSDKFKSTCESIEKYDYCKELEEYIENVDYLTYIQKSNWVENEETGEYKEMVGRGVILRYDIDTEEGDKDYELRLLDMNDNNKFEIVTLDNKGFWKDLKTMTFGTVPKLALTDDDENGVMDIVALEECKMVGELASFSWNPTGDEPNFCVTKEQLGRKIARHATEIGAVVGAVVGFFFGGGAGAGAGFKVGSVVGASVLTVYTLIEGGHSTVIWPGKSH
jgi:hypothetical protein